MCKSKQKQCDDAIFTEIYEYVYVNDWIMYAHMLFSYIPKCPPNEIVLAPTESDLGQWEIPGLAYWKYTCFTSHLQHSPMIFLSYTDPKTHKMAQQGCFKSQGSLSRATSLNFISSRSNEGNRNGVYSDTVIWLWIIHPSIYRAENPILAKQMFIVCTLKGFLRDSEEL